MSFALVVGPARSIAAVVVPVVFAPSKATSAAFITTADWLTAGS